MKLILGILFLLIVFSLQKIVAKPLNFSYKEDTLYSRVNIKADSLLNKLIDKRIEITKKQPFRGYRIQIYSGGSRQKAYDLQTKFMLSHTDLGAYVSYLSPNYRCRIGDFLTREEALEVKQILEKEYDIALIVPDKLNKERIYSNKNASTGD